MEISETLRRACRARVGNEAVERSATAPTPEDLREELDSLRTAVCSAHESTHGLRKDLARLEARLGSLAKMLDGT